MKTKIRYADSGDKFSTHSTIAHALFEMMETEEFEVVAITLDGQRPLLPEESAKIELLWKQITEERANYQRLRSIRRKGVKKIWNLWLAQIDQGSSASFCEFANITETERQEIKQFDQKLKDELHDLLENLDEVL